MKETVKFLPNVPVQVSLAYSSGRRKALGRPLLFTLTDGRVMFLPVTVADQIEHRNIQPRQPFFICKFKAHRGALDQWRIWLPGETVRPVSNSTACLVEDIAAWQRAHPGAGHVLLAALVDAELLDLERACIQQDLLELDHAW